MLSRPSVRAIWLGLLLLGIGCTVAGSIGPWIPHKTAALTVTGFELSEFVKFFPQVQGGLLPIRRELFLLPLVVAGVELGLVVHRFGQDFMVRLFGTLAGTVLALAVLPPYPLLRDWSYRGRLVLAIAGTVAVLLSAFAARLPGRLWGIFVAVPAFGSGAVALWQFALVHPLFVALYRAPVCIGWGTIVCAFGLLTVSLGGIFTIIETPMLSSRADPLASDRCPR